MKREWAAHRLYTVNAHALRGEMKVAGVADLTAYSDAYTEDAPRTIVQFRSAEKAQASAPVEVYALGELQLPGTLGRLQAIQSTVRTLDTLSQLAAP